MYVCIHSDGAVLITCWISVEPPHFKNGRAEPRSGGAGRAGNSACPVGSHRPEAVSKWGVSKNRGRLHIDHK